MYKKMLLIFIYLFQFSMSVAITVVFLILPLTTANQHDGFVSFFLWLFFMLIYFSMARSVKKMLGNKYPFYDNFYGNLRKDLSSFLTFSLSSSLAALFIYIFMKWIFSVYLPNISSEYISVISALNGLILGTINFTQYFFLPED